MDRELVDKALSLAIKSHFGQYDKSGRPYIVHVLNVFMQAKNDEEKTVAALHDVIEDTDATRDDLSQLGFPEEIVDAVDRLSRREGESIEKYMERVNGSELSKIVKRYDLNDNGRPERLTKLDDETRERLIEKYKKMKLLLED